MAIGVTESMPRPRFAREYLITESGVFVPGWLALWLEAHTDLRAARTRVRGEDRVVDEALLAIRHAAMSFASSSDAGSVAGTAVGGEPEPAPTLNSASELGAADVGGLAGITDRAVRKAIAEQRLQARLVAGRWLITESDARAFAAEQRRRTA